MVPVGIFNNPPEDGAAMSVSLLVGIVLGATSSKVGGSYKEDRAKNKQLTEEDQKSEEWG